MRLPYVLLDVFTDEPFRGNQLCVVPDARSLSSEQMQALARETNLSETTFILPRDAATERERGIQVRIFTVEEELPFAGHPTLGTSFALRKLRQLDDEVHLDLKIGLIPVRFRPDGFGEMTQRDPQFLQTHPHAEVAQACGFSLDDLDTRYPCQTVTTGNNFLIVPVRSTAALSNVKFVWHFAQQFLSRTDAKFCYLLSIEDAAALRLRSRMIFYNGEDPGTGSAAGPAIAYCVQHGIIPPDARAVIEQGVEMRRRCDIHVAASRVGDRIHNVRVGGYCVQVGEGSFHL